MFPNLSDFPGGLWIFLPVGIMGGVAAYQWVLRIWGLIYGRRARKLEPEQFESSWDRWEREFNGK